MSRLLPLPILVLVIFTIFNFQNLRRDFVYKMGISGDPTTSCCNVDTISQTGNFDEGANLAIFNSQVVDYPKTSLVHLNDNLLADSKSSNIDSEKVLGTTNANGEEKWIEVALSEQKVRTWEGSKVVMEFPISSGKWAPTPKGDYRIWYKTRYQSMIGGSKDLGTYYNLSNVPNNMFFYQGYAIHGAYWHNNFGQPMSHGCVNTPLANAAQIFEWAGPVVPAGQNAVRATADNPGTRVYVH